MSLDKIAKLRLSIIDLEAEVMKTIDDGATLEEAGNMLLQLNLTKRDMGIVYDAVAHRFGEMMDMEVRSACMCALSHVYRTFLLGQAPCRCARAVSGLLPKAHPKWRGAKFGLAGWGAMRSGAGLIKSLCHICT